MLKQKRRMVLSRMFIEALEDRQLLSAATTVTLTAPTSTLLGQTVTVNATVQATGGFGLGGVTVSLIENGDTSAPLSATTNGNGVATFTFGAGNALYVGTYALTAQYAGDGVSYAASTSAAASVVVSLPTFTTTGDGLQMATVTQGTGAGAVAGDNLTMEYTGFYTSTGAEFDESSIHSPGTFTFTLDASPEQVISGFDEGSVGIEQGETRVLVIPSALGYQDGKVRTFVIQSVGSGTTTIGPAAELTVASSPTTAVVGSTATPVIVNVSDSNGNQVTSDTSNVTIAIASGPSGATLGGTLTVAAVEGQATFGDLTFSEAGTYTLTATDGSLTSVSTSTITVSEANLKLVFGTIPDSYVTSSVIAPVVVDVEDQNGNIITTDDSQVTLVMGNTLGIGATLEGTTTVAAVNGVATFSDISIPTVGEYSFGASDPTAAMATSAPFIVTQPATGVSVLVNKSTVPSAVVAGAKLTSAYQFVTFSNDGTTKLDDTLTTTLYVSSDGQFDSSAVAITKPVNHPVNLAVGRSAPPFKVTVPSLPASLPDGYYDIFAQAVDSKGNVTTLNTGYYVTVAAPFFGLSETISKLTLASSLVGGSKSHATATIEITNNGNEAAPAGSLAALYASSDGQVDSSSALIANGPKVRAIPVGKTVPVTIPIKLIPDVTDGSYSIIAQVTDPAQQVTSVASATNYTIAAPFVQLAIVPGSIAPASLKIGSSGTLTVAVTNNGNIPTTGSAVFAVGLSTDGATVAIALPTVTLPDIIQLGVTKIVHVHFKVPKGTIAGNYFPALTVTQDGQTASAIETVEIEVG